MEGFLLRWAFCGTSVSESAQRPKASLQECKGQETERQARIPARDALLCV